MPQIDLNLTQIDARVKQMRGVGMAQGMHRGPFSETALLEGGPEGGLHAVQMHRFCGAVGLLPAASGGRKQPEQPVSAI